MKKLLLFIPALLFLVHSHAQKLNEAQTQLLVKKFDLLQNTLFPEMEMEREDGSIFNTSSLIGKTVYVDVWFTLCPPCLQEIPYAKALKKYFAADTNVVFLNICIENIERKTAWKEMLRDKKIEGINVFYARNRPQKVNLLRQLKIQDFPTYYLLNKEMKLVGYDAPRPSDKRWIHWAIFAATRNKSLGNAYFQFVSNSKEMKEYLNKNNALIDSLHAEIQ